jgi:hypothetical protein
LVNSFNLVSSVKLGQLVISVPLVNLLGLVS